MTMILVNYFIKLKKTKKYEKWPKEKKRREKK